MRLSWMYVGRLSSISCIKSMMDGSESLVHGCLETVISHSTWLAGDQPQPNQEQATKVGLAT